MGANNQKIRICAARPAEHCPPLVHLREALKRQLSTPGQYTRPQPGPDDLRLLWATACESMDIYVSRRVQQSGADGRRPCYGLWARRTFNPVAAEERLRAMLDARGYLFTLTPIPV